jgi:hypothetical protein
MTRLCSIVVIGILWASAVKAGEDEEAVERVLLAEATSSATFVETKDKQAVLKLYTTTAACRTGKRKLGTASKNGYLSTEPHSNKAAVSIF